MKKLLAVALVLAAANQAHAQEVIEKEFDISGEESIEINLRSGGSIDIRGWGEARAVIRVQFTDTDPDDFRFDFDRVRGGLEIRSEAIRHVNRVNIHVDVQVPRGFDLSLRTAGGGITVRDIEGVIRGRTAGGELELRNLKGRISLSTGGGAITITDSELDGRVSTGGGRVLVENVVGDIEATSGGGNVVYRNVVTPSRTYPADAVYIRNAGGEIEVGDAPAGADVGTGGGDIGIRSAGEYARAHTGGGDITIDDVRGWVEASTGAGTIRVTMTGDPTEGKRDVTLSSGLGDIYLTLPENLSMEVEIELNYTRDSRQNFRIVDDFDLQQERTDVWDDSQGTPMKTIYGRVVRGDRRNVIRIRTTNGNVYLRKGR